MEILGVILWFVMPAVAGYTVCNILRWKKETNQIETYLIGFFFLFFMQGVIFVPCVFANLSYRMATMGIFALQGVLVVLALVFFLLNLKKKKEKADPTYSKKDQFFMVTAVLIFVANVVRMAMSSHVLREDMMLETVKTTVQTRTMFQYHPLTGCMMEAGMISSKKIVTLPLFYSSFVSMTGIDAQLFLQVVVGAFVLALSSLSASLIYTRVAAVNQKKLHLFWSIYGLLVLAGDYHPATLSYRILKQGYLGETICFAVILPYLLYVVVCWYQAEGGEEKLSFVNRLQYVLKLLLPLGTSFVITGLGTGIVLLVICLFVAAACCLIKSIQEVRACKE